MKKVLAIILTVLTVFSLFACTASAPPASPSTANPPDNSQASVPDDNPTSDVNAPNEPESGSPAIGFFDRSYDYTQNKKFKVAYLITAGSALYDALGSALKAWAERMNCEFNMVDANGDNDLFISSIETLVANGTEGILLDPDLTIYPAVIAKCRDVGVYYQTCMGVARDSSTGLLLGPSIGFDQYDYGRMMMEWLDEYRKTNWPEAKLEEIGVVGVTLSSSPPIHDRIRGGQDTWAALYPEYTDNFFIVDCITGSLSSSTAYQLCGALLPTKPQFKYWLGVSAMDDLADGFASAAIDAGMSDSAVTTCVGGTSLIIQWDSGEDTPWKAALMAGQTVFSEPMMGSLYAQMMGWAQMEDLWPEFIDHSTGEKYASFLLTSNMLTIENYQRYLEWLDLYTGIDMYQYDVQNLTIDEFTVRRPPPSSFAG
jgi:ABC-type sugar transport system substrate-binding protein